MNLDDFYFGKKGDLRRLVAGWFFSLVLLGVAIASKDNMAAFLSLVGVSILINATLATLILRRVL